MSGISTGTGLISGIDTANLIKQLMALESRPLTQLQTRIKSATDVKTAYTELTARFLSVRAVATRLSRADRFTARSAASSNEEVLTATATAATPLDTYNFTVKSLVANHQLVSGGYSSRDAALAPGTLTFERGKGQLTRVTKLAELNGTDGVRRGMFRITDRSGGTADIDLRAATDVQDILSAINTQSTARIKASIQGDKIVLTDQTGASSGNMSVVDLNGGSTASDLGLVGTGTTQITGKDLVSLASTTPLSRLNDGNGVRVDGLSDDIRFTLKDGRQIDVNLSGTLRFGTNLNELNDGRGVRLGTIKITNRSGGTANVNLAAAQTVQDVVTAINGSGLNITASLSGNKITLSDASGGTSSNLKIEDVSGYSATDLGIKVDVAANATSGTSIYRVDSLGSVMRAIQYASGNGGALTVGIAAGGDRLVFTDTTSGIDPTTVEALNGSKAADDLGLTGDFSTGTLTTRRLLAGLNTVLLGSLNGGTGVDTSALTIDRTEGGTPGSINIDVSAAESLQDVIDAINNYRDGGNRQLFQAEVSSGGTGLTIRDIAGGSITGLSGATATDLKLTAGTDGTVDGANLQLKYLSEATLLSTMNNGRGVKESSFKITNSAGVSSTITINSSHKTLRDVIKTINATGINVTAGINANGDGLVLTDTAGGASKVTVTENGGTTAADLNLLGTGTTTGLDGSYSRSIEVTGSDTLSTLAAKINAANAGVKASIINDGTGVSPFRLLLSSTTTGSAGKIGFDLGATGMSFSTLSEARDAKVVVGSLDSPNSVVITSTSNKVENVVDGLTLDLKKVSDAPVSVTVGADLDQVVGDIQAFVETINGTFDRIDELTKYVPETGARGILLGDNSVEQARQRIYAYMSSALKTEGLSLKRLDEVGLRLGSGARIQFDESKLRQAFEDDPEAVQKLFSLTTTDSAGKSTKLGFGGMLEEVIDGLTESGSGLMARRSDDVQDRIDLFNKRAVDMQARLDVKQKQLEAKFAAMESALSALQNQQSALANLAALVSSSASTRQA